MVTLNQWWYHQMVSWNQNLQGGTQLTMAPVSRGWNWQGYWWVEMEMFFSLYTSIIQRGNVQQFASFVIWPPGDLLWLPARSHPLKLGGATKEIGQVYEHGTWPSQNIKHHALFPTLWWKSWSERCKERQGLKVDGMTSMGETVAV